MALVESWLRGMYTISPAAFVWGALKRHAVDGSLCNRYFHPTLSPLHRRTSTTWSASVMRRTRRLCQVKRSAHPVGTGCSASGAAVCGGRSQTGTSACGSSSRKRLSRIVSARLVPSMTTMPMGPLMPVPMGNPLPPLTRGSPTAPDLMPEMSKAWAWTSHRAASAKPNDEIPAPSLVVKNLSFGGTSLMILVRPEYPPLLVCRSATCMKGVWPSTRKNRS